MYESHCILISNSTDTEASLYGLEQSVQSVAWGPAVALG